MSSFFFVVLTLFLYLKNQTIPNTATSRTATTGTVVAIYVAVDGAYFVVASGTVVVESTVFDMSFGIVEIVPEVPDI